MLEFAEKVVYAGIALPLIAAACILLVRAAWTGWLVFGDFSQTDFSQTMVLALLDVLLLGLTSWLLRRKEREPDEGKRSDPGRAGGTAG
ncbi:hypothetical protein [Geodermatophilus sp. TF02-6]|uniref:hypothetical protein n=1 Tax=Geodermatophilus sp. TF02-6 TaxID=2250575 RepID=UPI0018F6BC7B|nr:hypothetical protein [Geodermatophilus sp. TF02-6]